MIKMRGIFKATILGLMLAGCSAPAQSSQPEHGATTSFIYVRIPGKLQPVERHRGFEDPIDEQLQAQKLGMVTGGGTMQNPPDATGNRTIAYTGVDIEVEHLDEGRSLLRDILPSLGAHIGTQIEFTVEDQPLQDRLAESGWILDEARTDLHPGFDI